MTHCLITHCQKGHFDHLDRAGIHWLRERQVQIICTPHDVEHLRKRGLNVRSLHSGHSEPQLFLGGTIRTVSCTHGLGLVEAVMEHGVGYLIEMPGEPTLYLSGDTILTDEVRRFVQRHQPQVCVVPAGGARFDLGGDIIMGVDEVIEFARIAKGRVVANHLEALSHCPVRRDDVRRAALEAGLGDRLHIPDDGETIEVGSWMVNCPEDDRFILLSEHEDSDFFYSKNYLDITRTADLVIIQITCNNTRTLDMKKALYRRVVERLALALRLRPEDVFISLVEVEKANWSLGVGEAQYANSCNLRAYINIFNIESSEAA